MWSNLDIGSQSTPYTPTPFKLTQIGICIRGNSRPKII